MFDLLEAIALVAFLRQVFLWEDLLTCMSVEFPLLFITRVVADVHVWRAHLIHLLNCDLFIYMVVLYIFKIHSSCF